MSKGSMGLATGVLANPLKGWDDGPSSSKKMPKMSEQIANQKIDTSRANADQLAKAKDNIQSFINNTIAQDYNAVQQNPKDGRAQSQLAADLASLHNIERQFFSDAGNTDQVDKYKKDAGYTAEGTADEIMKSAGANKNKSTDYVYNLTSDGSGGYRQTALLKGEPDKSTGTVSTSKDLQITVPR